MISTKELKNTLLFDYDMDLVGIAPASALSGEPVGHRPEDLLPGAKSIIVVGRKITSGVVQSVFRAHEDKFTNSWSAYRGMGMALGGVALQMNQLNDMALYLEDHFGMVAMPLPFGSNQFMVWDKYPNAFFADPYGQGMPLDIYKAAMAAGLGEFGWSNRFMTPEFGPRQNLSVILVDAELEYDAPYSGKKLCDPAKCGVCAKMCPTKAIPADLAKSAVKKVEGKSCEVGDLNSRSCAVASAGFRKEFNFGRAAADLLDTYDPTEEELEAAFAKKKYEGLTIVHHANFYCEKCLIYCPVGNWKETFYDRGVTKYNFAEFE